MKFRAEPKDILYFILFSIFLFYLIAVGIGNITSLSSKGTLVGFNPFPGLSKENILNLFDDFKIIRFKEIEKEMRTGLGTMKHWHLFLIIAQKK